MGSTRAFGAVQGPPASSSGASEAIGSTRAFGAVQGPAAPVSEGVDPGGSTRAFGAVAGTPEPSSARAPSRSFGDISPAGEPLSSSWSGESAGSRGRLVPEGHGDVPWANSAPTSTLSLPDDPAAFARTEASRAAPGASLLGGAMERPLPSRRPSGDLPPELLGAARPEPVVTEYGPGTSSPSTVSRLLLVLAVLAGIGLAGYLAYPAFRDRNTAMPAEAVAQKDVAVAQLRRDDPASREQALKSLQSLAAAHPKYAEAQAELAVALTLQLSDLNAEFDRLRVQSDQLKRQADQLTADRRPEGWKDRADSLREQMRDLEREQQPMRVGIEALRKRLDALMLAVRAAPEVEPAATVAARLKAQALYASVTGHDDALALAERLRQVESAAAWSRLAHAEFALSSGSPGTTLQTVSKELEALRTEDSTLMRAYVLGARLALRQNDVATARTLLDETLALNNKHEVARRMLAQLPTDEPSP